jgi:hypothetical protein
MGCILPLLGMRRLTWINARGSSFGQSSTMLDQALLEHSAHLDSMRKFARGREVAEASAVAAYERERHELAARAKLHRFVGILAEKRAKDAITKIKAARSTRR